MTTETTLSAPAIFDIIEQIAATSSKIEKENILRGHINDMALQGVLTYALDPTITFGVKALPEVDELKPGRADWHLSTWAMLSALQHRSLTGNDAHEAIKYQFGLLCGKSATLLRRVLLKDLRAGFGANTVNKVKKGLIPDFPYMRCSLPKDVDLTTWRWADGVFSQEKADGMFANLDILSNGEVVLSTRQGSIMPIDKFQNIADQAYMAMKAGSRVIGELLVMHHGAAGVRVLPREIGNGMLNSVLKGGDFDVNCWPVYQAWDCIPFSAAQPKGSWSEPYSERFDNLKTRLSGLVALADGGMAITIIPTKIVHSLEEAYAHYAELLVEGKEGTIIKTPTGIWRDATSRDQIKLKLEADCELEITGFNPGEGKNAATFGSIECKSSCRQLVVNVSGFSDAERQRIHAVRESLIGSIMTVRANSIMYPSSEGKPHSLFLPRHVEFRTDKTEADSLSRIEAQFENAIKLVASKAAA